MIAVAAELSHRPGLQEVGDRAEQLLADAATPHNAAQTMELAVACGRAALRVRASWPCACGGLAGVGWGLMRDHVACSASCVPGVCIPAPTRVRRAHRLRQSVSQPCL
jgi:hypothetical protein